VEIPYGKYTKGTKKGWDTGKGKWSYKNDTNNLFNGVKSVLISSVNPKQKKTPYSIRIKIRGVSIPNVADVKKAIIVVDPTDLVCKQALFTAGCSVNGSKVTCG
jgi:hypothetical protein